MQSSHKAQYRVRSMLARVMLGAALVLPAAVPAQGSAAAPTLALPDFTEVVARTEASVVNIRTTETVRIRNSGFGRGGSGDPYELFRWFFGPDFAPPGFEGPQGRGAPQQPAPEERTVPRGVGSGFFISDDGYVLTNNHVVDRASDIFVTLTSGKEYKATVVGTDPRTDVALLKIDAKNLSPLPIGDSTKLRKGQWVLAIGSPFGLDSTVTSGIISAINRETGDYLPFIQTDVAVNPGNSGGPLINLAGEVVGINSQIVSRSGGFMGISLAIPIDEVMRIVEQLKADGKVTRGRIGVQIGQVSEDVAKALGLEKAQGALVSMVERDGPAAKAGVQSGDVITHFDGKPIAQMTDLPRMVGSTRPGTKSALEVWRKGKTVKLDVVVGEMPNEAPAAGSGSQAPEAMKTDALGLQVADIDAETRKNQRISGGVQVMAVEEPAASAGLAPGDIILTVNNVDIKDAAQFAKVVSGLDKSRASALLVMRGDQSQWVTVVPRK
ncbi:DegQ family serine endoprotease [Paracandidimonas soli]|uniref:DegQ family serine endoprotease n=1 Tax=Paracandidimonas soli TaxID=1917182 RepID=UPI003342252E